ncbi:MAG: hypothetical protein R3331_01890 [Sulfurospirillaceae bacterium]|nr:hypothetical protein [Sulfurospirillaceae bacterium]
MSKKIFLITLLLASITFAKSQKMWEHQHSFVLKKDQVANIYIDEINIKNKQKNSSYLLKFKWVVYENGSLILLLNYMGYPHQYILKRERSLESVKIKLLSDLNGFNSEVYALINFSNFNKSKQLAGLNVYIKDMKKRVLTKFIDPK